MKYSLVLLLVFAQLSACSRLNQIISELTELRADLSDLFKSPVRYHGTSTGEEWVVYLSRGKDEAVWLANLTETKFVGPVRGFENLFVFHNDGHDLQRGRRHLEEHATKTDLWAEYQGNHRRSKRAVSSFNDPLWSTQWELNGQGRSGNMRISEAWKSGYTGKGVTVSILDDGIDYRHEDLSPNYYPEGSYDLNDNDPDPMPTMDEFNKHGTRCAGEVAMVANNSKCGVGVAFGAKVGGMRMLDGRINDRLEGEALGMLVDDVDIMSASWGPDDSGTTVEGPGRLAKMAFSKGIREGRHGLGSVYVWASGNGGHADDCNCDGYASSIYTFTVSGASSGGDFPWYGENCAATLTSTFSSGAARQQKIVTVDPGNTCTDSHTGTSAAAPIAAGVIALALQANPNLNWREIQHLAVWTSNPTSLSNVAGWRKNGAGLWSSSKFGFGLMDADAMTQMAANFTHIGPQHKCQVDFPNFNAMPVSARNGLALSFNVQACQNTENEIISLEHVVLTVDIESNQRGKVSIWLESPSGMISHLLSSRSRDFSIEGFKNWPLMSVQFWGEDPRGIWKVHIDQVATNVTTIVRNVDLTFYGTATIPKHEKTSRRIEMAIPNNNNEQTFQNAEQDINITELEKTLNKTKRIRRTSLNANARTEKHLIAIDRILRRVNEIHSQPKKRRQTVYHYPREK